MIVSGANASGMLRNLIRWFVLAAFVAGGMVMLNWAVANASFSVPAEPIMSEIYKTRAMTGLYLAILSFAIGALLFMCLKPTQARRD